MTTDVGDQKQIDDSNRASLNAQQRLMDSSRTFRTLTRLNRYVDDRAGTAKFLRRSMNKVFPDHWSFMLGEIALYSFVVLLLTGTYLGFFFKTSQTEVPYEGSYAPLKGVMVSDAYASALRLSFDVRAGLLIRQMHHWAALLFVAAISVHAMRVFFSGAFRKPREINWVIGVMLLLLAIAEGFCGYSLLDDLLSGEGLRIAYGITESIPVVGTWLSFLVWGGEFPGDDIVGRLYIIHILLIPGVILALITAHLGLLWHQKHSDFPGTGKSSRVIVGSQLFPRYAMKSVGFFFLVVGVLALLGGLAQINPIWLYGPYSPADATNASQPDWYVGWLIGALRLMLPFETRNFGVTIPWEVLLPAVVLPLVVFAAMAAYPFLEERFHRRAGTSDELDLPRNHPVRTGIGIGALSFYVILLFAGGSDVIATTFHWSVNTIIWILRVGVFLVPAAAFLLTYNFCRGLQQDDDDLLIEGRATGVIQQERSGEFVEVHVPLPVMPVPPRRIGDPEVAIAEPSPPPDTARHHAVQLLKVTGRNLQRFFTHERDVGPVVLDESSDGSADGAGSSRNEPTSVRR